jgi:HSP20 family protein
MAGALSSGIRGFTAGTILMMLADRALKEYEEFREEGHPEFRSLIRGWRPEVELEETIDSFIVRAALPGVDPSQIKLRIRGKDLIIEGERRATGEEKKNYRLHSEFDFGTFYRNVPLPDEITYEEVDATYDQGILEVVLPKKVSEANTRTIPVKVERHSRHRPSLKAE